MPTASYKLLQSAFGKSGRCSPHSPVMKGVILKPHLILIFSCAIFIAQTFAELPEAVKNDFSAHRERLREARLSNFQFRIGTPLSNSTDNVAYTGNWAGAVQVSPPSGAGTFKSVSAQWTLPTVSRPPSANGSGGWSIAEWVGIDGYTCSSAILQAGTVSYVQVNSTDTVTGAYAWYEWFPLGLSGFSNFTVAAGDTVEVSVTAKSKHRGIVVVKNLSTGNSTSITLDAPNKSSWLCGTNAEWILEDLTSGGLAPFSRFTNASFQNCSATTTNGARLNLHNATLIDMKQNNTVLATATRINSTELKVSYG